MARPSFDGVVCVTVQEGCMRISPRSSRTWPGIASSVCARSSPGGPPPPAEGQAGGALGRAWRHVARHCVVPTLSGRAPFPALRRARRSRRKRQSAASASSGCCSTGGSRRSTTRRLPCLVKYRRSRMRRPIAVKVCGRSNTATPSPALARLHVQGGDGSAGGSASTRVNRLVAAPATRDRASSREVVGMTYKTTKQQKARRGAAPAR